VSNAEVDIKIKGPEANSQKGTPKQVVQGHFGAFAHNFCFILKIIWLASELINRGSRVTHNKTMQKLSAKLEKGASQHLRKGGGPRRAPRSPPHPHLVTCKSVNLGNIW